MENETLEGEKKFYSLKAISIATFLGGPVAAGVLIRRNFLNLNEDKKAINALFIGILSTILLFIGIFSIPEAFWDKLPNSVVPAIYTGLIYLIADKYQGQTLKEHKGNNGRFYSAWKAAGIGLLFSLIIVAGAFGYVFASDIDLDFDAKTYDTKINEFFQNEATAVRVFEKAGVIEQDELIEELKAGKTLWEDNYQITQELSEIENLPPELILIVEKLQKYSNLRITSYNLFIKAISEETDKYDSKIKQVVSEVDKILTELNQLF